MYIYGGVTKDLEILNDLWEFDLKTFKWKNITFKTQTPKLFGHLCFEFQNSITLFGGQSNAKDSSDYFYLIKDGKMTQLPVDALIVDFTEDTKHQFVYATSCLLNEHLYVMG